MVSKLFEDPKDPKPKGSKLFRTSAYDESMLGMSSSEQQQGFKDDSQYDKNLTFGVNQEQNRAFNQGVGSELANGLARIIPNAALGIVGNAASILDIEDYYNQDKEVGNDIVRWTEEMKGEFNEQFPIHRKNPGASLDYSDSAYWFENGSSLADSILGFVATGAGVAAVLGKVATVIKLGRATQVGLQALALNQAEAVVSATQIYDQVYKSKLDEGLTDDDAKQSAADAASYVININRLNIPLNITSSMAFLRSPGATRIAFQNASKTNTLKNLVSEGLQEYGEETINYIAEQEGLRSSKKGYKFDTDKVLDDIFSKEGFEAGLLGFIGGAGQTLGTSLKNRIDGTTKHNQERYDAQQLVLENYKKQTGQDISKTLNSVKTKADLLNQIQDAANQNDDQQVNNLQHDLLHVQALEAFENGTTEQLVNHYKDVLSDPNKEEKYGKEVVSRASQAIQQIERAEKIYNSLPGVENPKDVFFNRAKHSYLKEENLALKKDLTHAVMDQNLALDAMDLDINHPLVQSLEETKVLNDLDKKIKLNVETLKLNALEYINLLSPDIQEAAAQAKNDKVKAKVEAEIELKMKPKVEAEMKPGVKPGVEPNFKPKIENGQKGTDFNVINSNIPELTPDTVVERDSPFHYKGEVYYTVSHKTNGGKISEITAVSGDTGQTHTINLQRGESILTTTNEVQKPTTQGKNQNESTNGDQREISVPNGISGQDSVNGGNLREEVTLPANVVTPNPVFKLKLETGNLTPEEMGGIESFKNFLVERKDKNVLPKLTVKKEAGYQFNIYAKGGVKIGYLPTTAQMKDYTTEQKVVVNRIKDSLLEGVEVEFTYNITSGIDITPNLTPISERNPNIYSYNGEAIVFRQKKGNSPAESGKRSIDAILGSHSKKDENAILADLTLTDQYVMKVSSIDGTPRYIGLKSVEMDDSGYQEISDILNGELTSQEKVDTLNNKFFVPANPVNGKRFNFTFKVFNNVPTLYLSENLKGSQLQRIFPIKGIFNTKKGFMKSVIIESNKNAIPVKKLSEVLSYVSREILPGSSKEVVLSSLRSNTSNRLFGGINVVPVGTVKTPSILATGNAVSTTPIKKLKVKPPPVTKVKSPPVTKPKSPPVTKPKPLKKNVSETESSATPKKLVGMKIDTTTIDMNDLLSTQKTPDLIETDFDQVKQELLDILPEGFGLERLSRIAVSNGYDHTTMGAFVNNVIYLAGKTERGTHYHEAFHAIYRKLFTVQEKAFYYKVAGSKVDTSSLAQERFLKENPHYQNRSNIEGLILEEYMADLFQAYMNNKPVTLFGKMFKFLKGLVNSFLNRGDDFQRLFSRVDSGEFKFRSISLDTPGIDQAVYKTVPFTQIQESNELVRLLTIQYLDNKVPFDQVDNMLDILLLDLKLETAVDFDTLYSNAVAQNGSNEEAIDELGKLWYNGVAEEGEDPTKAYRKVFVYNDSVKVLKDQVKKNLKSLGGVYNTNDDSAEDVAVQSDEVTERDWEASPFEVNPTDDASADVKALINYTGYYLEGKLKPVDTQFVYNTLLLSLSGLESYDEMVNRLNKLGKTNPQIKAVYNNLMSQSVTNSTLAVKFQQAFSLEKVEYVQIEFIEGENGKPSSYKVFSANRKDLGDIQLNRWRNQFVKLSPVQVKSNTKVFGESSRKLSSALKFEGTYDQKDVENFIVAANTLGIDLSQGFIEDILDGTNPIYTWGEKEGDPRRSFVDEIGTVVEIMLDGKNPFTAPDIVIKDNDSDKVKKEKERLLNYTATTRIRRMGTEDAKFRSDILMTSFQNSENKTVYPFTAPSHMLTTARQIVDQNPGLMAKFQDSWYQLNPLIESENRDNNTLRKLKLSIYNGIRETKGEEGQTFKNIDAKSYHLSTFSLWKEGFLNPFQIEAKSIATVFKFPVNQGTYVEGEIRPHAKKYLRNFYRQDELLIQRSISDLKTMKDGDLVEGFHFIGYTNGVPNRNSYYEILDRIKKGEKTNNDLPRGFKIAQLPEMNTMFTHEAIVNGQVLDSDIDLYYERLFRDTLLPQLKSLLRDSDLDPSVENELSLYYDKTKENGRSVDDFLLTFILEDFIYTNAYSQLQRGPEQYYKGGVDITKRAAGQAAAGKSLLDGEFRVSLLATTEVQKEVGGKTVTVDPTDAQGMMSGRRHLLAMERLGKLTPNVKAQIEALIEGGDISWTGDFTLIPWKNVIFNGDEYIKCSTLPLLKGLTSQRNLDYDSSLPLSKENSVWIPKPGMDYLHNVREQLDGEEFGVRNEEMLLIDEAYYDTAFKKNQRSKNFPNSDGTWSNLQHISLMNKDWRLQVENPSGKTKVTYGTQLLQLIDSEMNDAHLVEFEGEIVPLSQVREQYQSLLHDVREDSMTKALSLLDKTIDGNNLFIEKLSKNLEASKSDNNTLEFFSQSMGDFKYSTDLPNLQGKFEEMFLSYFSKSVFSQKTPGLKLTLVSSYGIKNPRTGEDLKIHRLENGKIELAEVILSGEFLHKYGLTIDKFYTLPISTQDEILTMVGYRIPTQSHHSMIPFKVVGFVPAYYGSIAIAPSEITYLSGSDYDVDSLFVHRKEFKMKDGVVSLYNINKPAEELWVDYLDYNLEFNDEVRNYVQSSDFKDKSISLLMGVKEILGMTKEKFMVSPKVTNAARYNKVLETNLSFLTNPSNAESLFTPASMDSLKSISKEIYKMTKEDENLTVPYQSYVSRYTAWINNSTGKANVGNAASANKINAFLTKYQVELTIPVLLDGELFTGYADPIERDVEVKDGKITSRITRRKGDSLSTVVSAMTDNAKERLAAKLNLTKNNLSIFSNMIALGMGLNRTMLFAKQPIMVQLTKQFDSKSSIIASPGSTFELVEKYLQQIEDLLGKNNLVDYDISSEMLIDHINDNMTTDSVGVSYKSIKAKESANGFLKKEDIVKFQFAWNTLKKFKELNSITNDFSRVGKLLSLDKEIGIDFSKMDDTIEAYNHLLNGEKTLIQVTEAFDRDKNVVANYNNLLKVWGKTTSYFLSRTQRFQKDFYSFADLGVNKKSLTKLRRDYVSYLALRRVEADLNSSGKSLSSLLSLIKGDDNRITKQYDTILEKFPLLKENKFLGQLQPVDGKSEGNPYFRLSYNTRLKNDPLFTEELQSGYKALQSHYSPEVRAFSKSLFNYLMIKDSLSPRNESFLKLINPNAFIAISTRLKGGVSQNGNLLVGEKELFAITDDSKFRNDFESLHKESHWDSVYRFTQLWFSQKANREKVNQYLNRPKPGVKALTKTENVNKVLQKTFTFKGLSEDILDELQIPHKEGKVYFPLVFRQYIPAGDYNDNAYSLIWIRQKEFVKNNTATYVKLEENRNRYLSPYALSYDQVLDEGRRTPKVTEAEVEETSEGESIPEFTVETSPATPPPSKGFQKTSWTAVMEGNRITGYTRANDPKLYSFDDMINDTPATKKGGITIASENKIILNNKFQKESTEVTGNLTSILDKLKDRFGVDYEIDETMTSLGRFENGKVYINPLLAKLDTPFHEFAHPFTSIVKKDNPLLYKNLVDQTQSEGKILERVKKLYPELSLSDQIEEAIVQSIGEYAAGRVKEKGLISAIKRLLSKVGDWVKSLYSDFNIGEMSPTMTLSELGSFFYQGPSVPLDSIEGVKYQRPSPISTILTNVPVSKLEKVIEDIKLNLTRQIGIYNNRVNSPGQVKYLAKLEGLLYDMTDDMIGIESFINQASFTLNNLRDRMDNLSDQKSNSEQIRELVQLGELAQSFGLLDEIKTAVREELDTPLFRTSPFVKKMLDAISERDDILTDYKEKGIPLLANYLFDQYDNSLNTTLTGTLEKFVLTKEKLISQLKENPKDISTVAKLLYPVINTNDAVLSLFAKGLKNQLDIANQLDIDIAQRLTSAMNEYREEAGFSKDNILGLNNTLIQEIVIGVDENSYSRLKLIEENTPRYKALTPAGKEYHRLLQETLLNAQENIPESAKLGFFLPGVRKSPEELIMEGNYTEAGKEKLKELTTFQVDDENYGLQTLTGDQYKSIPIYYASKLASSETSHDLLHSFLKYSQSTNKYRAYNHVAGEVNLTLDILESRQTLEVNSKGENLADALAKGVGLSRYLKKPGISNTYDRLKTFIDMEVYGEREDKITVNVKGKDISVNKVFGTIASATSIISLAGNVLQGINNVTMGNLMNLIEAQGARYFNKKDFLKAGKEYAKNLSSMVADVTHKGYKSKVSQLSDMYDAIQGSFRDEYGTELSGSAARKMMSTKSLFFFQKAGEHQIQVTNLLAFLYSQKVMMNGQSISLYEAYETDTKGKVVLKPGVEWTNEQRRDLMHKIHKVNKDSHGVYNKFDSLQIQKSAFGKMALIFRKYIVPTIRKRYDGLHVDYEENALSEGYYRTLFRLVLTDLPNFKTNVMNNWSSLQPFERENIRKSILEIGTMALLFVMMMGLGDDDDENKKRSYLSALTLYEAKRLQSELMFYTPIGLKDQWRVLKSPTAIYGTVDKIASVLGQAIYYNYKTSEFGLLETYKKDSGLNEKGDSKMWGKIKKVIPVISKIELATDPQTAYNSFLKANQ